jgi:hypothetical protein
MSTSVAALTIRDPHLNSISKWFPSHFLAFLYCLFIIQVSFGEKDGTSEVHGEPFAIGSIRDSTSRRYVCRELGGRLCLQRYYEVRQNPLEY